MEEIKIYDQNGQQITILVQWDLDVYIYIHEEQLTKAHPVHFFNSESDVAYVVSSTYEDGIMSCKIPNRLLFSALPITGYIYTTEDNETYRNTFVFTIPVRERPIPSDFAYLEDDTDDYLNVEKVLAECIAYAESAAASALESENWTNLSKSWAVGDTGYRDGEDTDCSKYYCLEAEQAATVAVYSAESAADSRDKAETYMDNASISEDHANNYMLLSQSYAVGESGVRDGEDTDNSKYYYEQVVLLEESLSGALRPMGTVTFENLPALADALDGDMYNISDEFVTTDEFKEGAGNTIPLGSNVYKTIDGYWDVLAGSPVTGVKGEKEGSYRRGNVNLTLDNLGIAGIGDRVDYLETRVASIDERVENLETKTEEDVDEEDVDNIFENYTPLSAVQLDLETKVSADSQIADHSEDIQVLADSSSSLEDRVTALEEKTNEDVYEIDVVEIFEEYAEEHPTPSGTDDPDDEDGDGEVESSDDMKPMGEEDDEDTDDNELDDDEDTDGDDGDDDNDDEENDVDDNDGDTDDEKFDMEDEDDIADEDNPD